MRINSHLVALFWWLCNVKSEKMLLCFIFTFISHLWELLKCVKWVDTDWAWWVTPVIPALWEAKAGGSQGQEIETILVNMVKPRLY